MRKEIPNDKVRDVLEFSTKKPRERLESIRGGLQVRYFFYMSDKYPIRESLIIFVVDQYLQYGQSEYVRNFGMTIDENPLSTNARVIEPPKLKYNVASLQPSIVSPLQPPTFVLFI